MTIFSGRGLSSIYTMLFRMLKDECNKEKFKLSHTPLEDFTNCLWQRQPNVLPIWIAYRFILFLYFFATFVVIAFKPSSEEHVWYKNFIYIACWSYFLQVVAFGLTFAVSMEKYLRDKKKKKSVEEDPELPPMEETSEMPIRERTPWHYKTLWCFYTMSAASSLSLTTMFWFFIFGPEVHDDLIFSLVTRTLNSLFFILDVFLNAIPFRFLHIYIPCAFVTTYSLFTVVYQLSGGTGNDGLIPIYTILDWREPQKAFSSVAMFLACSIIFHCGMCVINIFKNWLKKPSEPAE